jgi:glucose-6-phosphate dehydrogenase assembly protein OpcA
MNEAEKAQIRFLPPHKVAIPRIQQELGGLWDGFRQDLVDGHAIVRACMSNLIVYCDNDQQSEEVEPAVGGIAHLHPARVILLTGYGNTSDPDVDAYVAGHYCGLGSGWQVCSEQIRVVANADSNRRLPSVTRAQLVGDLPTTLWWASRQPPPFAGRLFFKLANMSDQIIYDSTGWTNPSKGIQAMSRWVAAERSEYVIFNLAWRRLKPWRRLLSQVLDPVIQPDALTQVSSVTIEHGPHALTMASLLLGWLASRLGWQPTDGTVSQGKETLLNFSFADRRIPTTVKRMDEGKPAPHKVRWCWRETTGQHCVVFALLDDERLGIMEKGSDSPARVVAIPKLDLSELVSAQMADRTRDKVFEEAVNMGNAMTSVLST